MALQTQSREQVTAWLHAFHATADSLTSTTFHKFYTQDATLQFANNEPVVGLPSILSFFNTAFPRLESMKHEVVDFDVVKDKIYMTCTITYVVKHDPKLEKFKIPAVGIFHLLPETEQAKVREDEGLLRYFEVYLDAQAVWRRMGEVASA